MTNQKSEISYTDVETVKWLDEVIRRMADTRIS
jgi:hypothetical protein